VSLAKYLVELTMLDYGMIAFLPSHIALACTMLATHTQHGHPALPRPLQRFVVDGERDAIGQCVLSIHKLWIAAPRSKLQAVRLKYERAKHYKVSTIAPPSTPPIF
jgi:cyclin A